jgi:magnesium transporter
MLVNCVAYQTGRKVRDIQREEIVDYLRQPDSFVWVALLDPEEEELAAMQAQFGLHELAVDDARHGHQRPKIEEYGDSLFVVVHMLEFDGGELRTGEVNIFAGRNYVLSV